MKTFLVNYPYEGKPYSIDIYAETWEEAYARLEAIRNFGRVAGELEMRIPVGPNWFVRVLMKIFRVTDNT